MQPSTTRLVSCTPHFPSVLVLAPILVLVACAGSILSPETQPNAMLPTNSSAQADVTKSDAEVSPAEPAAEGPVIYRPEKPTDVFPPAPPQGLTGIAVPAIVSEPVAVYKTDPESLALAGTLVMTSVPEPKRRSGPPRAMAPAPEPAAPDQALDGASEPSSADSSSLGAPPPPGPSAAATSTSFDSLEFDDNSANNGGFLFVPPDPSGAAGPDHVMNVVNASVQIHTKTGTELLDSTAGAPITGISLASFFSSLSPVNDLFDPKVIYDQHADRFVVVALEREDDCPAIGDPTDSSRILVAVSDDSDPNGTWILAAIPSMLTITSTTCTSASTWSDYPGLAIDEEAVYITMNQFTFGSGGTCSSTFCDDRLWVIDKFAGAGGGIYGGGTATISLLDPSGPGAFNGTQQPAHVFGTAPSSPNVGTWLTFYSGLTSGAGPEPKSELVQVVRLDDPIGPGTPTFVGPSFVSLGDIDNVPGAAAPPLPNAPQSGSATAIETNDRRALHAVWRDNHRLYTTFTIEPEAGDPNAGEATAHWVILNTATLGGATPPVSLAEQGNIGGEDIAADTHTFLPSIAVNDSHDVAIGFSASAASIYPGSYYTNRKAGDPSGTTSGSATLRAGLDDYVRTFGGPSNRWGDYSAVAVDPFDECFWVYNQHAIAGGTVIPMIGPEDGRWGTAWGYFCESCPTNPATLVLAPGTMVSGVESKRAPDQISTSMLTVEGPSGDLTLDSDKVSIDNGLIVEAGGTLTIRPCS